MKENKTNIYNITLIILAFLVSITLYTKLPNQMPLHWNILGKVDNYGPKFFGSFLFPLIMILTWLGMKYLPKIDPKKENYKKFENSYRLILNIFLTFFFILHITIIVAALGYNIPINKIVSLMTGALFVIIGNYLPKAKSNFFYGIKTPWTLSSEESWNKTHRLGGKLFVLAGSIVVISSLLLNGNTQSIILIVSLLIASFVPVIASYFYAKNK